MQLGRSEAGRPVKLFRMDMFALHQPVDEGWGLVGLHIERERSALDTALKYCDSLGRIRTDVITAHEVIKAGAPSIVWPYCARHTVQGPH